MKRLSATVVSGVVTLVLAAGAMDGPRRPAADLPVPPNMDGAVVETVENWRAWIADVRRNRPTSHLNVKFEVRGEDGEVLKSGSADWWRNENSWLVEMTGPTGGAGAPVQVASTTAWVNGFGLQRAQGQPTRRLHLAELPYEVDSLGILDGSLTEVLAGSSFSESLMIPDDAVVHRLVIGTDRVTWQLQVSPVDQSIQEWWLEASRRDDKWTVGRAILRVRGAKDGWQDANWSLGEWLVTNRDATGSSAVTRTVARHVAGAGKPRVHTRLTSVVSRGTESSAEVMATLNEFLKLRSGEALEDSRSDLHFKEGSRVFTLGGARFLAPAPLTSFPDDIASLVKSSTKVTDQVSDP